MKFSIITRTLATVILPTLAVFMLTVIPAQGAPLVYEGFSGSASGSGDDYTFGNIDNQSETRTGFSGSWDTGASATGVQRDVADDNMSYSGFATGTNGVLENYERRTGASSASRSAKRSLSYTAPETDDIYYVFGWSNPDAVNGSVTLTGSGRTITTSFSANGSVSVAFTGSSAINFSSGTGAAATDGNWNLMVIRSKDDPGTGSASFYDTADIWINPTITGGSLGTADGSGQGIMRELSGGGVAENFAEVNFQATVGDGDTVLFDEFYITTDSSDFLTIIPEPSTAILAGLGLAGLVLRRRRK